MSLKEQQSSRERNHIVFRHFLDCLKHTPPKSVPTYTSRIGLPPDIEKNGLVFCEDPVPLNREDVRRRIEYQINLLLNDFQETTVMWLKRKDRYGKVVEATLVEEGVPKEFSVLPALESGYDRSAASPSLARGWWQLLKPTVVRSPFGEKELDWSIQVNQFKDERRDLTLSTRSAARYLKWIRSKLSNGDKQAGWLIAAAAYNAGLAEIAFRTVAYKTDCYWDMKLSRETEDYVPRWIALFLIDSHREFYPIDVPKISPIEFETLEGVRLNRDLPLTLLATLTGSSVRFIREINGALRTGTSAFKARIDNREVAHTINLPQGSKDVVRNALRSQGFLKEAP
jgi:membrane-bound lytic murein transglycosylase D